MQGECSPGPLGGGLGGGQRSTEAVLAAGARGARTLRVSPAVPAAGDLRVPVPRGQAGGQLAGRLLLEFRAGFVSSHPGRSGKQGTA